MGGPPHSNPFGDKPMTSQIKNTMLAAAMLLVATGTAKADGVDLANVLHGGPSCDHVIHLMLRHGVNNSHGYTSGGVAHYSPYGSMVIPHAELGDLELVQIAQLQVDDQACGPKFAVTVRNTSTRDVCGFRISLVALLGRIHPSSPTAVVNVDKICAGAAAEFHVQLPIECLAMGNRNGQVIGFQRLVVAIDSFDQFVECNEANNIKVFARTAIPAATVVEKTEAVEATATATATATVGSPVAATSAAPAVASAAPAGQAVAPAAQVAAPAAAAPVAPVAKGSGNDLRNAINQLTEQQQDSQAEATTDPTI